MRSTNTLKQPIFQMKLSNKNIAFFLLSSVLLFGCVKKDDFVPDPVNSSTSAIPGMGETEGALEGTPYYFPPGIELIGAITGDDPGQVICQEIGYGWYVNVFLTFVNHGQDTIFALPAGLTFQSLNKEDQNGILIQEHTLHFTGGDTCITRINAFCINASRHASGSDSRYITGPVTHAAPMLELISLLKNKEISNDESFVQDIVWNISDYGGMTDEDRAGIAALPDK